MFAAKTSSYECVTCLSEILSVYIVIAQHFIQQRKAQNKYKDKNHLTYIHTTLKLYGTGHHWQYSNIMVNTIRRLLFWVIVIVNSIKCREINFKKKE